MAFSSAIFGPNTGTSMAARSAASNAGKKISQMGRGGDTMAIHATPFTRNLLRALGGSGGVNPKTGLTEFQPIDGLESEENQAYDVITGNYQNGINYLNGLADDTGVSGESANAPEWLDEYNYGVIDGNKYGRLAYDNMLENGTVFSSNATTGESDGLDDMSGDTGYSYGGPTSMDQSMDPNLRTNTNYGPTTYVVRLGPNGFYEPTAIQGTGRVDTDKEITEEEYNQLTNPTSQDNTGLQAGAAQGFTPADILRSSVGQGTQFLEYDINGDGKVSSEDARALLLQEAGNQTGGGVTDDEVFLDENGDPYTGNVDVNGRPYNFENGVAQQQAEKVADEVIANTDPNDFAGQIEALKAEIKKLSSPEEEVEIDATTDFEGLVKKLEELFEKYMSSGYSPAALMNMFGFTDGDTSNDFNFMIPTYSGSDNVYTRKAVKDRDTGEIRYINVPIGDVASGGGSFQDNRRAGFGSTF
jgi:hypothetical protein